MITVVGRLAFAALCVAVVAGCRYEPALYVEPSPDARPAGDQPGSADAGRPADSPGDATMMGARPDAADTSPSPDAGAGDGGPDARSGCGPNQIAACYTGPSGTSGVGLCREGSRTCQADGTFGACQGERIPGAEQCNGLDEDCDGAIDEGCPVDGALLVTEGARASSPAFGSLTLDQNQPFTHRCPPGQAIVAFTGNSGYAIDSLGVICARLQVKEDRGAQPFRYPLALEPGQSFAPVGGTSGGVNNATRCPPGFVVNGIGAWPSRPAAVCPVNYCSAVTATACPTNFGLEIHCSRYQIEGAPGGFRFAAIDEMPYRTAAREEVDLTPFGFPSSKAEYRCPAGQVVVDVSASVGPWPYDCAKTAVNGLRVTCAAPTVSLR
jgi:hypothetical protein